MKYLFAVFLFFYFTDSFAQNDSVVEQETFLYDTVLVADTTYVIDTIVEVDTILVKQELKQDNSRDTLVLSEGQTSWSRIPEEEEREQAFFRNDSGLWLISAKIGFSDKYDNSDWTGYSISTIPPVAMQAEYFFNSFVSYGGQLLYSRSKIYNDTTSSISFKESTIGLAALGTFHYGSWLQDVTHDWFRFGYLDLYVSMALRCDLYHDVDAGEWDEIAGRYIYIEPQKETYLKTRLRPIFGVRYYISDCFSINLELGKGNLGFLTSSVSWKISGKR